MAVLLGIGMIFASFCGTDGSTANGWAARVGWFVAGVLTIIVGIARLRR